MKRDYIVWLIVVALLLFTGWLIGKWTLTRPGVAVNGGDPFRAWFWEQRSLDLTVQVGLLFVGALGITALLPEKDEGIS